MKFKLSLPLALGLFLILTCILASTVSASHAAGIYNKTLDSHVAGNINKNPKIAKYLPKDSFDKNLVKDLKNGSKVYRFGNGSGKRILICGSVHGDEVQGGLSVTRFLKYLKKQKFKGTIYVVPFSNPYTTQRNTRYYHGYDPNRKAKTSGTPVNNIIKFAVSHKVDYLIDVHSGLGVSNKGLVYYQGKTGKKWAKYIQQNTACTISTKPTKGTLRTTAQSKGIIGITLEVPKKASVTKTSNTEYKMISYAFDYLNVIKKDLKVKKVQKKSKYVYVTVSQQGIPATKKIGLKYSSSQKTKTVYFKFSGKTTVTMKLYFPYKKFTVTIDPKKLIKEINEKNNYLKIS